jgi:hypothetical protein
MMTKPSAAQIHLSKPIKKEKSSLNDWMLKFGLHKFQWGERADSQQESALRAFL